MKSQNGELKTTFSAQKFLGRRTPKSDADILCPYRNTSSRKVWFKPPTTDPDDISQSSPDFWPIFEFQALKNCWGQTHPH